LKEAAREAEKAHKSVFEGLIHILINHFYVKHL